MTDWTNFWGDLENGVLIGVSTLQQIINNTSNIYERVSVLQNVSGRGIPVGGIMLWKGTYATIPDGFQLADGTNGTPDLRGKFAMGIASTENDDDLLETGGGTSHTHTLGAIATATKHKHTVYLNNSSSFTSAQSGVGLAVAEISHNHSWSAETNTEDEHTHSGVIAEAEHLPPYTKYYWIVRIPT